MADLKISQLTGATTPLAGTEVLPIVQSGVTKKVAVSDLTAGRDVAVLNLAATQSVGTSLGSGGVYLSGDGGPDTGFVAYNYKNISGTESVPVTNRASWRQGFLNGSPVEWNLSYRAANAAANAWTKYVVVSSAGDATLSVGNLVQGTAAKGINFTANTPAAGMTSQLLNWYEEGTWTPTVASGSGSITSYSSSGTYTRVGRQVTITAAITITNNGTGATYIKVTNLPFTIGGQGASGAVYESAVTGNTCVIQGPNGGTQFNLWTYNNGYPGATGATFNLSFTYIV